ncbi:MAG TPA: hypothetical protein VGL97_06750 [Bryobacteraceae bacterium]|jgi:hypothetical protein
MLPLKAACLACLAISLWAQSAVTPPVPLPKPQFFAGVVLELDQQHIKVWRSLLGKTPESRTFLVNANTKMNRTLVKVKARVTVRYRRLPEGDVALDVQIRPAARSTKAP